MQGLWIPGLRSLSLMSLVLALRPKVAMGRGGGMVWVQEPQHPTFPGSDSGKSLGPGGLDSPHPRQTLRRPLLADRHGIHALS